MIPPKRKQTDPMSAGTYMRYFDTFISTSREGGKNPAADWRSKKKIPKK